MRPPANAAPDADPIEDHPDLPGQVLGQFRAIFGAVRKHFREVERRAGLGGAQVWALSTIMKNPGIGVTGLAGKMDVHQSTASNLVRALLSKGLIRSDPGVQDRRAVQLRILPAGRAVLRKVPGPPSGILPQALGEMDVETLLRLQADLARLLEHIAPDAEAAKTPLADL